MKKVFSVLLVILLAAGYVTCKKNQLGGKSKVRGVVAHHGKAIPNATVYIKFNAKDFPGTDVSVYESTVTANQLGYYEINNFYKGDYYLYATGTDTSIPSPYIVKGGLPVSLKSKEEKDIDIPVSED